MFFKRTLKVFLIGLVAFALATFTYAYAASNTVPATDAGDGAQAISGYTISAVHYNLNGTNPANIDSVTFTIAPAATGGSAQVQLVNAGTWYSCTISGGTNVSCTTTGATAAAAANLRVVIAQ
jgi:hypothetical protein